MLPFRAQDILNRGDSIAARLPAHRAGYESWISVCPFKTAPDWDRNRTRDEQPWQYRVECFDLPSHLDHNNYEVDDYFEYRLNEVFLSIADVEAAVATYLPNLELLDELWRVDCPI